MSEIIIFNPYITNIANNRKNLKELVTNIILRRDYNGANRKRLFLNDILSYCLAFRRSDTPLSIEVETLNRCNSSCSFCPVNVLDDPREYNKMSESLMEKIANELEASEFNGLLALYGNNEPLLDDRIVDVCRLFRKKAKKAFITLATNGILLDYKKFMGLFKAGLDELVIDNYNDNLRLIRPVARMLEDINSSNDPEIERYKQKTKINIRKKTEVLYSRGGYAPNKKKEDVMTYKYYSNHSCVLPFMQFIIRPSGEVSLCSHDALGKVTLGDLNKQSITEVWNGERYREVRRKLLRPFKYGRKSLEVCEGCDCAPIENFNEFWKRGSSD